ncbi:hypothetical protein L1987_40359 [Smallanthus sonchifolius]|uniref:Uncharacterized protein n=1 Tax=Smallanthus sonchifolius TaxID=185202 RepID=A0ACB9GU15_9ASTR|nr:hypothetical protein L1987_40359 [Smallanthus sonchifolius]
MHHTCSQGSPPYSASLEPERELHEHTHDFWERLKAICSNQRANDGVLGARSLIARPSIPNTNTSQIPSHVMSTITHATQFHGLEDEDAPGHLSRFMRICDTFNITGVSKDAIYLSLFPFSLSGRASTWLETPPDNSITTWEDLQAKFFKKYYPSSRPLAFGIRSTPFGWIPTALSHGLGEFYNGLTFKKQQMFNTTAGGHIMDKLEPAECEDMFESFARVEQHRPSTRTSIPSARIPASSPRGVHQVNPDTSVAAALAAMSNEIKELKLSSQRCEHSDSTTGALQTTTVTPGGERSCAVDEHGRAQSELNLYSFSDLMIFIKLML